MTKQANVSGVVATDKAAGDSSPALVSVIIPVYNAEAYLYEALESVQIQSYPHFEAIMVDDGSTDSSADICRDFVRKDSRFRLFQQENMGLGGARNTGIEAAKGSYLSFLDADDSLYPQALELLMQAISNTGTSLVIGRIRNSISPEKPTGSGKYEVLDSDNAIIRVLYQKDMVNSVCGSLYATSLFHNNASIWFSKGWYEDLDIFYRLFEKARYVTRLDKEVYFYRDNPKSFINTWSIGRLDALDVTDRIVAHFRQRAKYRPGKNSDSLLRAALDRRFSAHFNILLLMLRCGCLPKGQVDRCMRIIRQERRNELADPRVRVKNKLGALVSYGGLSTIKLAARVCRN